MLDLDPHFPTKYCPISQLLCSSLPFPSMGNHRHRKTTFLPLLCSSTKSISITDDTFSPRISCTGQIKRSNKIAAGIPPPQFHNQNISSKSNSNSTIVKYSKLKRLFSSNSMNHGRHGLRLIKNCDQIGIGGGEIRLDELDPPLPVIKTKREVRDEQGNTIWERRRSGGVELKSLQLQQIQLNRPPPRLQPIATV